MFATAWLVVPLLAAFGIDARDPSTVTIQRLITPVSFYGYRGSISPVVGVSHSLAVVASKEVSCPTQLSVRVHKAVLRNSDNAAEDTYMTGNNDCTEFMRNKCLHQSSCLVSPDQCKSIVKPNSSGKSSQLIIQYSCEPATSPKALYNGFLFVEGVSRHFLLIKGDNPKDGVNKSTQELQRSLHKCSVSTNCQYVTCEDGKLHNDEYFDDRKAGRCAYLNPNRFKLSGYAVYLNYTGICSRPQQLKTRDFYEVAKVAKSQPHASFSIAYQGTSQFNISPAYQSWICRGIPTIVPMAGHVVAVPAVVRT